MSQSLAPRVLPTAGSTSSQSSTSSQRPRKISTACGACKQRKTRCSGGDPCDACATRSSQCRYDASSDQRRKIANQRNVQDLQDTQTDLQRHRQLLGGMIAIVKAGNAEALHELITLIQSGVDLSQLAAHVRNEHRSNPDIQQAYDAINFLIDGPAELPSPMQILGRALYEENPQPPSVPEVPSERSSYSDTIPNSSQSVNMPFANRHTFPYLSDLPLIGTGPGLPAIRETPQAI